MTPEKKAKKLVKKYYNFVGGWTSINRPNESPAAEYEGEEMRIGRAKQCAYIAIDEILSNTELVCRTKWWQSVKDEVRKITQL